MFISLKTTLRGLLAPRSVFVGCLLAVLSASMAPAQAGKTPEIELNVQKESGSSSVTFSPDGNWLASGSGDRFIKIWNPRTGELKGILKGHTGAVRGLAFTPDSKILVSGGDEKTLRVWDVQSGRLLRVLQGLSDGTNAVAVSRDGKRVAATDEGGDSLGLWDLNSGKLLRKLNGRNEFFAITFTPDGKSLATVGAAPAGKKLLGRIVGLPGKIIGGVPVVGKLGKKAFPTSGISSTAVKLRDLETGKVIKSVKLGTTNSAGLAFSSDGRTMVSCSDRISVYDLATGDRRAHIVSPAGTASGVAISPDGGTIAAGAGQFGIFLVDVKEHRVRETLFAGQSGVVKWLEFSPDGRTVATGNNDNSVKLWQVNPGRLIATMYALAPDAGDAAASTNSGKVAKPAPGGSSVGEKDLDLVSSDEQAEASAMAKNLDLLPGQYLTTTPEGYFTGSPVADRYISIRLGRELYPAECFQARYRRPDLLKRSLAGFPPAPPAALRGPTPPFVRFTSPTTGAIVPGEAVNVTLEASDDSNVLGVLLFVNGARAPVKLAATLPIALNRKNRKGMPGAHRNMRTFSATIPFPPNETKFRLQAIAIDDEQLQSRRGEIQITASQPQTLAQNLIGLCVGVSRYEQKRLNLRFADRDADALTGALDRDKNTLYAKVDVATITNEKATRQKVFEAIDALTTRVGRADTVVLSLSGHGWRSGERKFFFATHDINTASQAELERTALPWDAVVQRLIALSEKSKRVIVLLDACHSGAAAESDELVKAIISANAGVMIFASSRGSEVSVEDSKWQHGAFTLAVLEALAGKAGAEPHLTLSGFASYVVKRVGALTQDEQHPQPFMLDFVGTSPVFATDKTLAIGQEAISSNPLLASAQFEQDKSLPVEARQPETETTASKDINPLSDNLSAAPNGSAPISVAPQTGESAGILPRQPAVSNDLIPPFDPQGATTPLTTGNPGGAVPVPLVPAPAPTPPRLRLLPEEIEQALRGSAWTLKPQEALAAHSNPASTIAFNAGGTMWASSGWRQSNGSQVSEIALWEGDGKLLKKMEGRWETPWKGKGPKPAWIGHWGKINVLLFSPDGTQLLSGGEDGRITLWDVPGGKALKVLEKMERPIMALSWASPEKIVAITRDGFLATWNSQGQRTQKIRLPAPNSGDWIRVCTIARDEKVVVTGDANGNLATWAMPNGILLHKINNSLDQEMNQPQGIEVTSLALSPDGKVLLSSNHAHVYANGVENLGTAAWKRFTTKRVRQIVFGPDGATAAAVCDGKVVLLNPLAPTAIAADLGDFPLSATSPLGLAVSPRQDRIVAAAADGSLVMWK